jgi:N-acetyl-anhydromuramyl-L-alanine amidase AmpD
MKSPLATKEILTNNYNQRKKPILKFTPHHTAVAGAMAETIAKNFNKNSNSANYVIGNDGTIILCVPEEYRAWTSGNEDNDTQAITVEVCNSTGAPEWKVSDAATQALMTSFYENYLSGMSKREALLMAQKVVRETPGFEDPEYWAGFILLDALN